jgi:hypothetical protein
MTTQLLIYERAVPVSSGRHADLSVKAGGDFSFTRQVNSVPLLAVELPRAASEYAIVFAGAGDAVMPAVILGVRDKENLFVGESGEWKGRYVPAFVRRYPFVFATDEAQKQFTLCIDEEWKGCNRKGEGERLFDDKKDQTPFLKNVLEFLKEYQKQHPPTLAFCRKLRELDLLEPMQLTLTRGDKKSQLTGFMAVNRQRLINLSGDKLAELARTNQLELAFLHLHSLRNVPTLLEREGDVAAAAAAAAATGAAEPDTAPAPPPKAKGGRKKG